MSYKISLSLTVALLFVMSSLAAKCVPGGNCMAPNCRCWNDPKAPGGITPANTPQIIVVSFAYALNADNSKKYSDLFDKLVNPNGCPARGSFYVQKLYSSPGAIKTLYDQKHEIGVSSSDGTIPKNWGNSFKDVRQFLIDSVGVASGDISGARAPELSIGGDAEMNGLTQTSLKYDASCITRDYIYNNTLLWPYTYDFPKNVPTCTIGTAPKHGHPGIWELLMPELEWKDKICATPSACSPYMDNNDSDDAFNFFNQNFMKHYDNKRSPFMFEINPQWLSRDAHVQGSKRFLQHTRSAYSDTWIITSSQLLAWMTNPVPNSNTSTFAPWSC